MISKENATAFLIDKREVNFIKEDSPNQNKNNYEVLMEQIYIERSVSVLK